jgi:D-alanyl-lipoteichoic acid acyltransferase DltB (MBOAT superfamily)
MTLLHIWVFSLMALLSGWVIPKNWRLWFLLVTSLLALYWLQPSTPIRHLDFWFPTTSLALITFVWAVTCVKPLGESRATLIASLAVLGVLLAISLTRYLEPLCCLTPSRPPDLLRIAVFVGIGLALATIPFLLPRARLLPTFAILLILVLFVLLKSEPLSKSASAWLRTASGQPSELASTFDLPWLGFSFFAFRLIHVLRDHQAGKLPAYSLGEFITYAIFFPAVTAGPIDRSQRFMGDLRQFTMPAEEAGQLRPTASELITGGRRILVGLFKKFVIADSLALIALNGQNAAQINAAPWAWVLLYAYSLRIYFDFSGYTDIAIGLGNLMGFRLPENFDRPYTRSNLTAFWNSWHITLAQWFRAYFFNPVTRSLRSSRIRFPSWLVILIGQFSTMALIGLWHGITWNFFIWGAWHGLGLFIHNRWSGWTRPRMDGLEARPVARQALQLGGWFLTFQFVTLGWVWFALPNPELAWTVLKKLVGI